MTMALLSFSLSRQHGRTLRLLVATLLVALLYGCASERGFQPTPVAPGDSGQSPLRATSWQALPGWQADNLLSAWSAFLISCRTLAQKPDWATACNDARHVDPLDSHAIRRYFEHHFTPWRLANRDGTTVGTITGYYEPVLNGSRYRHGRYQTALYRNPDDSSLLASSRAELIRSGVLRGSELVWVDDPVEAAFLQIQGSGRIRLEEGGVMRVAFAGATRHPFQSFARELLDNGEITPAQATLAGIKAWAQRHPQRVQQMLNVNPRFVFFRELDDRHGDSDGPVGAQGVPLTAQRSIAVDPNEIPLGAPVFLSTTQPLSNRHLQRLMMAQDTGNAIRGRVRADYFWGHGDEAGANAARMKQPGQMWVLLPQR
ncbi:murein transglycosylase A [Kushneria aurantia]|uniref:Membrane-bound lytic murein transglycosylase A n=1 Tax=Kushneria aurantia TaxID=504092 RepID=A0ABV6G7C3_9GAMM|nr:MltA domain-containing protein [Kushneria aurantia]